MAKNEMATIPATLKGIDSFEAALAFAGANGELVNVTDLGDGFSVIKADDKGKLVGVPFVTVGINFGTDETSGRDYVVIRLVTQSGSKIILTDGSTGIKDQIMDLVQSRGGEVPQFINAPKGLTVSKYVHTDEKGVKSDAETYYFDLSGVEAGTTQRF